MTVSKVAKAAKVLGSIKSEAKALAARENGKLGGRPRKKQARKGQANENTKTKGSRTISNNENQQGNARPGHMARRPGSSKKDVLV